MEINLDAEYASRDEIYQIQSRRLRELVLRCWQHVPFYRKIWAAAGVTPDDIKEAADIKKLPFVTKQDIVDNLAAHPPFGDFQGDFKSIRIQASTGSTGMPKPVFHTKADWDNIGRLWVRRLKAQGVKEGDIAQVAFAYTLFVVGFTITEGLTRVGALVVPTGSGAVTSSERQLEVAKNWGTTVFCCTGSYMIHLAEVAKQVGLDCRKDFSVRLSIHCAEPLTEAMRQEIQSSWLCKTYDNYGSVETGAPMYECQFQNGQHINEDAYIYEVLNPETDQEIKPGEYGELVVTTLFKEAAPFIRYKIGDIASIIPGDCLCGRNFVRMSKIKGRIDEMMKVKGVSVYPTDFEAALKKFAVFGSEYLIVINQEKGRDLVELRVEYTGNSEAIDLHRQNLSRELRSKLGLSCEVALLPRGALDNELKAEQRIKYKRVLDLRKKED